MGYYFPAKKTKLLPESHLPFAGYYENEFAKSGLKIVEFSLKRLKVESL